ncbi:hypothetical protein ABB30_03375 [Stenotrophomonas ginsengisoli]|uniref:OmpR/PhoB-type domain-containing protein n=1 Tax=Stenotrophomonas ginsengisoli TaxID=336566 RepID=A0A0R0DKN8_9GAMM|nr:winged helix-turn-helix domain-containing protein [Stenotrophomonas ginsengisoli]KRG78564.1 hypothetical protein ABB30_03375 [Stenotrophomonas ginsengisoli]
MNASSLPPVLPAVLLVGQCRVETASREISGPASPRLRRVTPKALAVLRQLVAEAGQVVSREALLASVWPDSAPTDDVLTQAITQLRKAFAAADGSEPYIETIARSGYRLLVPAQGEVLLASEVVAEPSAAPLSTPATAPDGHKRRRWRRWRRWLFAGLAVVLLLVIALLSWLLWQQRSQAPVSPQVDPEARAYRLLTSSLATETYPALSPAGDWVAYTATIGSGQSQIHVRQRFANSPTRVLAEVPAGASDRLPVWSPDGSQIAFARFKADGSCSLMLVPADGTRAPEPLLDCSQAELLSFDFSADGRALVLGSFADTGERAGISLFHIAERRWQALAYPRQPGDLDSSPRISPDGRWLVFARNPQFGRLYLMAAGGGPVTALDAELAPIRGLTWLHDSRHVVAGRRIGMQTRLQRLDIQAPGMWQDLGVSSGQLPAAARQAPVLSFMQWRAQSSLQRFVPGQPAQALYPSVGRELMPALSADGSQLLLVSDRNGVPALWLGRGDGRGPLRLVLGLQPDVRQRAVWEASGERALVIGKDTAQRGAVYEVSSSGAVVHLPVPADDVLQAAYTGQANQLLVLDGGNDHGRLRLFDRSATPWRELARVDGVSQVQWDSHGQRALVSRFATPGLFAWDAASGRLEVVNAQWPTRWRYRSWQVAADGRIWYSQVSAGCRNALRQLAPASADGQPVLRCLDALVAASNGGFSTAPDGAVVMAVPPLEGGDIGLMLLPDTASGQLSVPSKLLIP